jgi:hypothetical protein
LVDHFCRFCLGLAPKRIVLSHLEELGREANDYWDDSHANKVSTHLQHINPHVEISIARMGEEILL